MSGRIQPASPGEPVSPDLVQLQRVVGWRTRFERNVSIAGLVKSIADGAARTQRRLGAMVELWETSVPAPLAALTRIDGLRGGTLQVVATSSAVAFEIDRLLRAGLERTIRIASNGSVVRVKVKVGELESGK
ncbi:MAG: DUF721 domain-containing protein [Phycisphaerales bacterium]|nr:DUF721 domain-containing protein [Phycisphaerales bacterium]